MAGRDALFTEQPKPKPENKATPECSVAVDTRNQSARRNRSIQMVAAVAHSSKEELFVSRASIQLQFQPSGEAPPSPRIYEWRTQVLTPQPAPEEVPVSVKRQTSEAATPRGSYYTPPRILGTEAKRKNLPQTLSNFFEAERHSSAWNRVTK